MSLIIRKAQPEDRQDLFDVEKKATPGLNYLPYVFDQFVADSQGEFIVAEMDGQLVACGKFSLLPDGSAWLETLRVIPEMQRHGIGKRFYERFFEIARSRNIPAMRMYTNVRNHASKGLAERYGFSVASMFRGEILACQPDLFQSVPPSFKPVADPVRAAELIQPFQEKWNGFLVMNRTFYRITHALTAHLAAQGMLYHESDTNSLVCLGARFMPQQALHIGILGGDFSSCLSFAMYKGLQSGIEKLSCVYPPSAADIQSKLEHFNFQVESLDLIVMEAILS
ncbi:MAG: GNAT family N-acetyltransferase [Anaerolineaceae bacterium]|nr:GNAT family N-acetyltransferase [Anaerolineaceae bacterium]